jgi:hypothetical protein
VIQITSQIQPYQQLVGEYKTCWRDRYHGDFVLIRNMMKPMGTKAFSTEDPCERLKTIGYSRSKCVRLYGEVLELLSDPYPEGSDIVIETHSRHTSQTRIIRIPKFIVNSARAA